MTQKEAIEALLKQEGKTKGWLADKLGVKQNAISQMLKRGISRLIPFIRFARYWSTDYHTTKEAGWCKAK